LKIFQDLINNSHETTIQKDNNNVNTENENNKKNISGKDKSTTNISVKDTIKENK
jgi:hypothetical protein